MRFLNTVFSAFILLGTALCSYAATNDNCLHRVVIDAGHGGKDPGGVSRDKKTYEKTIVLSIAQLLGEKIKAEYKDEVQVLYTRCKDVFVPLQGRADFANRNNADVFISIHINASRNSNASGHSVHVLGASSKPNRDLVAGNLDVCKRENSVILLEDDYSTKYQGFDPEDEASYIFMTLMQSAFYEQSIYLASLIEGELDGKGPIKVKRGVEQDPFYVLWKTAMPAVLLELGFITNSADLTALTTQTGRDKIATCVFNAFRTYKKNYDESMTVNK